MHAWSAPPIQGRRPRPDSRLRGNDDMDTGMTGVRGRE